VGHDGSGVVIAVTDAHGQRITTWITSTTEIEVDYDDASDTVELSIRASRSPAAPIPDRGELVEDVARMVWDGSRNRDSFDYDTWAEVCETLFGEPDHAKWRDGYRIATLAARTRAWKELWRRK
jgi:hypothetical protein